MNFNVIYLTPIHPIGITNRRGKNGSRTASPGDPGSPWAIGNSSGGHYSINPELGTMDDFEELLKSAEKLGIKIAMDIAFQCSPDHPYVHDHPEWFYHRLDGSIRYAENPPKNIMIFIL
ncbi:alpha-amylase family glycosyl hydrolase [Acidiplasma cupricumulans]|uniref:alpha-amylase family glycosyl hydrolase n=1 Tax=Acidiplasma cupricumulans TaxID=312540 RepID=UPI0007838AAE|nr:alpha-amylase family glycosyl hydrolase [Acidiplasma cupricumulans]